MSNLTEILWIEEETTTAVADRKGYLKATFKYNITICETKEDAEEALKENEKFDVIIVDVRIPKDKKELSARRESQVSAHYHHHGIDIIKYIYVHGISHKLFIYTNETIDVVQKSLSNLEVKNSSFLQKNECRSDKMFEKFIIKICDQKQSFI